MPGYNMLLHYLGSARSRLSNPVCTRYTFSSHDVQGHDESEIDYDVALEQLLC